MVSEGKNETVPLKLSGLVKRIIDYRTDKIVDSLESFVKKGETLLSVGDGDGFVTEKMMRRCGVDARGLDVEIGFAYERSKEVPLDYYDGITIPYKDDNFDIVSAIFVLHHCNDIDRVVSEIVRVARKKIIICEDVYRTSIGKGIVCLMDFIENRLASKDINIPYNFNTVKGWENTLRNHGLKIVKSEKLKVISIDPVKQHVFYLEKSV